MTPLICVSQLAFLAGYCLKKHYIVMYAIVEDIVEIRGWLEILVCHGSLGCGCFRLTRLLQVLLG